MSKDVVRVFIRDCRVELKIGHYQSEMQAAQPVVVTVECEAALDRRYDDIKENDLAAVINYRPIYQFITEELTQMGHIYLLESAAEQIITFCFKDPRITKVRVSLGKTAIFPGDAVGGIDMERVRA